MPMLADEVVFELVPEAELRHLAGKHDQKTHGSGGGTPGFAELHLGPDEGPAFGGAGYVEGKFGIAGYGRPEDEAEVRGMVDFVDAHQTPNPALVQERLAGLREELRDRPNETVVAVMPDGAAIFGPEGTSNRSNIPTYAASNAFTEIHNHPTTAAPSPEDIHGTLVGLDYKPREVHVTSPGYDYTVKAGPSGWGGSYKYQNAVDSAMDRVSTDPRWGGGSAYGSSADPSGMSNAFWELVAPQMGYTYTRTPRP